MTRPPIPALPDALGMPPVRSLRLPNGVSLHLLPADQFEVLRVTFVFRAGSVHQHRPFAASVTANMLAEGSPGMPARRIDERLDYYGSYYEVSIDRDFVYLSFCTLSKFFRETLDVAADILLRPLFPEEEFRTYCARRRQELTIERTKVETRARERFAACMFGEQHPYGISSPAGEYDRLARTDVEAHYARLYTADNCFVVCSGRIGDAERDAVADLAARLPRGTRAEADFPPVRTEHRAFVPHPGAVQSSIRIGRLLFPRTHPDFTGMQVVATALGGYFGSRLMRTLREERGYTYGVAAAMVNFEREGYFAVATQVGSAVTRDALAAIDEQIARLACEPMPEEELALVKNIMAGEMMRILDGPFGIADVTIENLLCGTGNEAVDENLRRIRAVTPDEVRRLAARYLGRGELVTVVAGAESPW